MSCFSRICAISAAIAMAFSTSALIVNADEIADSEIPLDSEIIQESDSENIYIEDDIAPTIELAKNEVVLQAGTFSLNISYTRAPQKDTWFAIYPCDAEIPDDENDVGTWCFSTGTREMPTGDNLNGVFCMDQTVCNDTSLITYGEYKLVMFYNDNDRMYDVIAEKKFSFVQHEETIEEEIFENTDTEDDNPETGDAFITAVGLCAVIASAFVFIRRSYVEKI